MADGIIVRSPVMRRATRSPPSLLGSGVLAGSTPPYVTMAEGIPGPATVRVLYRGASGRPGDGFVVAEVVSDSNGVWMVGGLNPALKFDVVCRRAGYNDMILSDLSPKVL